MRGLFEIIWPFEEFPAGTPRRYTIFAREVAEEVEERRMLRAIAVSPRTYPIFDSAEPAPAEIEVREILHKWGIIAFESTDQAGEIAQLHAVLAGVGTGFASDGIRTSPLLGLYRLLTGERVGRTEKSWYLLEGEPDPEAAVRWWCSVMMFKRPDPLLREDLAAEEVIRNDAAPDTE